MEYSIILRTQFTQEQFANYIYKILSDKVKIEVSHEKNSQRIAVWCEFMTMLIDTDELEISDYYREEHGLYATNEIWLEMMPKNINEGFKVLFTVFNYIIDDIDIDFLLEDTNSFKIILGKKGKYFYTQMVKDGKIEFPFHLIDKTVIRESEEGLS